MSTLKNTLTQLDDSLLAQLLEAAQFALNDTRTAKRVAAELNVPETRIMALAYILAQLSVAPDVVPDLTTEAQLDTFAAELAG